MAGRMTWWSLGQPVCSPLISCPRTRLTGRIGYTGKFTAQHITTHLSTDLKWAIAGRSRDKLEKLAAELKALNPDRLQPGMYHCANIMCHHTLL